MHLGVGLVGKGHVILYVMWGALRSRLSQAGWIEWRVAVDPEHRLAGLGMQHQCLKCNIEHTACDIITREGLRIKLCYLLPQPVLHS